MKAKVIEETPYSPNFKKGDVVEIVPGMETDSEGIWNIPGGRLFLCRTEDGHQAYMFPSCLQVLTGEESDSVSEFRKEATTRFAASILANPMWYKRFSGHSVAAQFDNAYFKKHVMCNAISYADALIKELRLKPYKDIRQTHKDTIRVFRPIAGTTIQKAAKEAVEMVKEEGRPIMLSFNSASILVEPYETEDTVLEHYHRWCHSRIAPRESEKKDYGHWKKIAEKKPDDGMDVFLFLGDRRIIRVIWSQSADDAAQAIGIAEQDCYPLYWCEAQMFE